MADTEKTKKYTVKEFAPLLVIFSVIILFTAIAVIVHGAWDVVFVMRMFMGLFFLVFGFFKVINLKGFVTAYREYDIVAKQSRAYAYVYPFIELSLGCAYVVGWNLFVTNWITLIVMVVSAVGVLQKLLEREEIPCACLGVVFKIPMTWVTFGEDVLMALMAVVMLMGSVSPGSIDATRHIAAHFESTDVELEIVDTPHARQQGLSGRESLKNDMGMLFIFEQPDTYGIWMKEMYFPIDIIWLDDTHEVVHIVEHAMPESFPEVFYPSRPARFVIEVASGFVKDQNITIGDVLDLST